MGHSPQTPREVPHWKFCLPAACKVAIMMPQANPVLIDVIKCLTFGRQKLQALLCIQRHIFSTQIDP